MQEASQMTLKIGRAGFGCNRVQWTVSHDSPESNTGNLQLNVIRVSGQKDSSKMSKRWLMLTHLRQLTVSLKSNTGLCGQIDQAGNKKMVWTLLKWSTRQSKTHTHTHARARTPWVMRVGYSKSKTGIIWGRLKYSTQHTQQRFKHLSGNYTRSSLRAQVHIFGTSNGYYQERLTELPYMAVVNIISTAYT